MAYGLIFNWNKDTQQVRLVSGSPVFQNSVAVHKVTFLADLVLGNIVTVTFRFGGAPITTSLTMHKVPDKNEWTLPLPDIVVSTAGTITAAFAILQPVVEAGETNYQIITTGNQIFTVITSGAQRVAEIVTPSEVENLQGQIDQLDQTLLDEQERLTDLVTEIQPFIGENGNWYIYDKDSGLMVDSGTKAQGPQGIHGEQGIQGLQGDPNVLSIGTVTSGAEAAAAITGDSPYQILNLVLPKGDKGDTGAGFVHGSYQGKIGTEHTVSINQNMPNSPFTLVFAPTAVIDGGNTLIISALDGDETVDMLDYEGKPYALAVSATVPSIICNVVIGGSEKHAFFRESTRIRIQGYVPGSGSNTQTFLDIPFRPVVAYMYTNTSGSSGSPVFTRLFFADITRNYCVRARYSWDNGITEWNNTSGVFTYDSANKTLTLQGISPGFLSTIGYTYAIIF